MDEQGFFLYLEKCSLSTKVVGDYISRRKRVEKHEGNLDIHFKHDRGQSLIHKLTYTKEDEQNCCEPLHSIPFKGKKGYKTIYEGTASLRKAVNAYFEFKQVLQL